MKQLTLTGPAAGLLAIALIFSANFSAAQDAGFFMDDWQEKSAVLPAFMNVAKPASDATVTVSVDMNQALKKVSKYVYGNNAVNWDDGLRSRSKTMTDLNNLSPNVLRWPGGSSSDEYFWNVPEGQRPADIPDNINPNYGTNPPNWRLSTDEYYDLRERTNCTGIITLNYGYARYGTSPDPVAAAAHMAADWVRYDNGRTRYWEIGNENFGSWEAGYQINTSLNQDGQPAKISGTIYGQHCSVFIDSLRKAAAEVGNDIKIGVVAYDAENSWDAVQTTWNEEMMAEVGDLADFLVVHSYFTPYDQNSSVSTILNSHDVPGKIMSQMVSDMTEVGKPMIPVAMTEWNIFAVGSMQMVSYVNGMLAALTLGEFIKNDYGLGARWDLVNGWSDGNDHAMFSVGGEPGVDPYNPRAAFFYMYYFQKYFGDQLVESSVSGNSNVISFASSYSSGECGIVLVNKGTSPETAAIDISNFKPGMMYYTMTLTGGTDNGDFSRKVLLNGHETDEEGGGPDEYASIEANACITEGGILIDLPPLSVVYMLVEKEKPMYISSKVETNLVVDVEFNMEVAFTGTPPGFEVIANGSTPLNITTIEIDPLDAHCIHINVDQPILSSDELTISYSGSDILSIDGDVLEPFTNRLIYNMLTGAAPRVMEAATNAGGTEIHLTFTLDMLAVTSSFEEFSLVAKDNPDFSIGLSAISVDPQDSRIIVLSTADQVYAEYQLEISYSGSGVTSTDLSLLNTFNAFPVENLSPGTPPEVVSASVTGSGTGIAVQFTKTMKDLSGFASEFTMKANGESIKISQVQSSGSEMSISLDGNIRYATGVTLNYNGTSVSSIDRGVLAEFVDYPVAFTLQEPTVFDIPGVIDDQLFMISNGMKLETCWDDGGGKNLCSIHDYDWADFMVNVLKNGIYKGVIRTASDNSNGSLVIQSPDADVVNLQTLTINYSGSLQLWESAPVEIYLEEGVQRLRLFAETGGYNLNWMNLELETGVPSTKNITRGVSVYPNPSKGQFTVEGTAGIEAVEIIDITGRSWLVREYAAEPLEVTFSGDIPAGIYLIKVRTEEGVNVARLVLE